MATRDLLMRLKKICYIAPKEYITHIRILGFGEGIDKDYSHPLSLSPMEDEEHIYISITPLKAPISLDPPEEEQREGA
jgi:hypothetical protein